jgi:hypothetical protein
MTIPYTDQISTLLDTLAGDTAFDVLEKLQVHEQAEVLAVVVKRLLDIEAAPSGSQTVLVDAVTLESADILALDAVNGFELVPAPGPSEGIFPLQVLFRYNHVTTNYNGGGTPPYVYVSTVAEMASNNTGFWGRQTQGALLVAFNESDMCGMAPEDDLLAASVKGQALSLFGSGTPFTTGDGTLTVTTFYSVRPLP